MQIDHRSVVYLLGEFWSAMMTIRPEQIDAFVAATLNTLALDIRSDLKARLIPAALECSDDVLLDRIGKGVALAHQYGFDLTAALRVFVNLLFEIDPGFHGHPDAQAVLRNSSMDQRERIRLLLNWLSAGEWLATRDRFSGALWP